MRYKLNVSYNCGCSYRVEKESDDLKELREEGERLDEKKLRWAIEDEQGKQVECSAIHKSIVGFMQVQAEKGRKATMNKHELFVEVEELIREVQERLLWWVESRNKARGLMLWALKSSPESFYTTFELLRDSYKEIEDCLKRLKKIRRLQLNVWRVEQDVKVIRAQRRLEDFTEGI